VQVSKPVTDTLNLYKIITSYKILYKVKTNRRSARNTKVGLAAMRANFVYKIEYCIQNVSNWNNYTFNTSR
jgi:hypothetical protein